MIPGGSGLRAIPGAPAPTLPPLSASPQSGLTATWIAVLIPATSVPSAFECRIPVVRAVESYVYVARAVLPRDGAFTVPVPMQAKRPLRPRASEPSYPSRQR